jgi:hypothetical protein
MKSRFFLTHRKNRMDLQQLFALSLRKNCSKKGRALQDTLPFGLFLPSQQKRDDLLFGPAV